MGVVGHVLTVCRAANVFLRNGCNISRRSDSSLLNKCNNVKLSNQSSEAFVLFNGIYIEASHEINATHPATDNKITDP